MYIRPWKTGGTSLLEILGKNFGPAEPYYHEIRPGHAYIRDLKQDRNPKFYQRLKDWYVITTIRNPLTWVISQYNWSIRLAMTGKNYDGHTVPERYLHKAHYQVAELTFAEFIDTRYLWAQEQPNYPRWDQSFTNRWDSPYINLHIQMEYRETGIRELFKQYNKTWDGQDYYLNSSGNDWKIDEWYTDDLREKVQYIHQNDFNKYYPEYLI